MSEQLFKTIIDQGVSAGVTDVLLQGFGEPLLDKEYVSKVRYAKKAGIKRVHCVTNGILLGKVTAEELLRAGIDAINISSSQPHRRPPVFDR